MMEPIIAWLVKLGPTGIIIFLGLILREFRAYRKWEENQHEKLEKGIVRVGNKQEIHNALNTAHHEVLRRNAGISEEEFQEAERAALADLERIRALERKRNGG